MFVFGQQHFISVECFRHLYVTNYVVAAGNTETPRLEDIANLINILRWPTEFNFPCIDLVRLALVNPPASDLLLAKHAEELLDILLQNLSVTDKKPNQMLALRSLANLFSSDKGNHMTVVETDTKKMNLSLQHGPGAVCKNDEFRCVEKRTFFGHMLVPQNG